MNSRCSMLDPIKWILSFNDFKTLDYQEQFLTQCQLFLVKNRLSSQIFVLLSFAFITDANQTKYGIYHWQY